MEEQLQQVKAMLRSVLLSSKEGVTAERFLADYRAMTGELLPYKKFGYSDQSSFVESLPDVVYVSRNKFGEMVYHAVADETTAHIQRLVSKQKSKKTKGPLRKLAFVRHPTKSIRGRGNFTQSRGRPQVSSSFQYTRGRGGYNIRGRTPYFSTTGEKTPHLNNPREKTPLLSTPKGVTSFSNQTQFHPTNDSAEVWESEDVENVDNDCENADSGSYDDQRKPFTDMKITFNVNNSSSKQWSEAGKRKVTDSNRMIFKALESTFVQQQQLKQSLVSSQGKMRQNSNFASNYEVPPRFRKSEENIATDSASANTNFTVSVPVGRGKSKSKSPELSHELSPSLYTSVEDVADVDHVSDAVIQQRVRDILFDAPNGLWNTRVEVLYGERFGNPSFNLIKKIQSWPHFSRVEPVANTDRAIVHLTRDSPAEHVASVTPAISKSSTATGPQPDRVAAAQQPVITAQPVIWKNFKISPPELLELGDRVTVYVTFALQCDDFRIQREDCVVDDITEQLLKHCQTVPAPSRSLLTTGTYCAALYEVDDCWYRAEVLSEVQEEMVKVSFIDYGNTEQVSVNNIRPLSAEIAHIPVQAIPCVLFGVKVTDATADGSPSRSMLAFAELVKEIPLEATTMAHTLSGQCELELHIPGDSVSINRHLVECHLVASVLAPGEITPTHEDAAEEPRVKEEEIDGEPDELVLPDDNLWDVYVSFLTPNLVVNMRLVGEQYSDRLEELEKLMEDTYRLTSQSTPIEDGMICIASVDNLYHRARVYSLIDGKASVYFCDHGDEDIIDTKRLRYLPPELNRTVPYQAIQAHLFGFESLTDNAPTLELLLDLALGKILVAEVISRDEDISIVLYDTESKDDTNINEVVAMELKKQGVDIGSILLSMLSDRSSTDSLDVDVKTETDGGSELDDTAELDIRVEMNSSTARDAGAEVEKFLGAEVEKYLGTGVEKYLGAGVEKYLGAEVDVRVEKDLGKEVDAGVEKDLGAEVEKYLGAEVDARVEKDVAAEVDAKIENLNLTEKSHRTELYTWTKNETKVNSSTEKSSSLKNDCDTESDVQTTRDAETEGGARIGTENRDRDPSSGVDAVASTETASVVENGGGPEKAGGSDTKGLPPRLVIPSQGQFMDVHIIWVVDPSNFVCVLYEMVDLVNEMMFHLNQEFKSIKELRPVPVDELELEKVYAGFVDGTWCRVVLKGFMEEEASVYLPDQATFNIISAREIIRIPEKFLKLPFAAIKARLQDIEPTGSMWSESAKFRFVELVQNKNLVAFIAHKDDNTGAVAVKLIDTSGETDMCIDEALINGNIFAKYSTAPGE